MICFPGNHNFVCFFFCFNVFFKCQTIALRNEFGIIQRREINFDGYNVHSYWLFLNSSSSKCTRGLSAYVYSLLPGHRSLATCQQQPCYNEEINMAAVGPRLEHSRDVRFFFFHLFWPSLRSPFFSLFLSFALSLSLSLSLSILPLKLVTLLMLRNKGGPLRQPLAFSYKLVLGVDPPLLPSRSLSLHHFSSYYLPAVFPSHFFLLSFPLTLSLFFSVSCFVLSLVL